MRIDRALFFVKEILHISIIKNLRTEDDWEEWVMYMLKGVEQSSLESVTLIEEIVTLM